MLLLHTFNVWIKYSDDKFQIENFNTFRLELYILKTNIIDQI